VPRIALAQLHHFEEPVISGNRGSGTIFFSHCNLACVFCQNSDISQQHHGRDISPGRLVEVAFELKAKGAHNINLVSPTPYTEMLLDALLPVKQELGVPIVWNSNGYELESVIRRLEPLVDVYLPDLKFHDPAVARRYCGVEDYFEHASRATGEMWRQKREVRVLRKGPQPELMLQGVIIRHLVVPGQKEDSKKLLRWIAENLGTDVWMSLMAQFTPVHRAREFPEINRRLRVSEYEEVCAYFYELGFNNGWVQELTSATSEYTPDFDLRGT
jgi:putative pyruvate formate lyase activating enzyme